MTKAIIFCLLLIALSTQASLNPREIANKFYGSFKNNDYKTMNSLYADEATFKDEVFPDLNSKEVQAMWNMLVGSGSIYDFEYNVISVENNVVKTNWIASYTFSQTGRNVVNNIIDTMTLDPQGKILRQVDEFDLCKWARQAFSFPTSIAVCTAPSLTVRKNAAKGLQEFIDAHPEYQ